MKKIYSAPESLIVTMNAEQMIAASVGVSNKPVDANQALSNKKDMWGKNNMWE